MGKKVESLRSLMAKRAQKREDVSSEEVSAAVGAATEEVTVTIDEVLAAADAILEGGSENPEEIMAQVASLREQIAALVPDVEEIVDAVDAVGAGSEEAADAERAANKITTILGKLTKIEGRVAKRNKLRQAMSANADALRGIQSGANVVPSLRTPNGNQPTVAQHKRTKKYTSDEVALRMGNFIMASKGNERAKQWLMDRGDWQKMQTRAATLADFATGGILIPEEIESEIVKYRDNRGLARQLCKVVSMSTETRKMRQQVDGPSHQYIGEGDTITTSDNVRYEEKTLSNKWVAIGTEWYQPVDEDAAISLADEFAEWCGYEMAKAEDTAVFSGTGLSATGGIIGMPYAFQKAVEDAGGTWTTDAHKAYHPGTQLATGSTWASITAADIYKMGGKLANRAGIKREYVASGTFYFDTMLPLIMAAAGIQPPTIVDGVPEYKFNGFTVHITDFMPTATAANQIPLLFGDFSSYLLGDRRGLTLESDKNIKTQLITTVATWRFGGLAMDWGTANSASASRKRGGVAALVTKN